MVHTQQLQSHGQAHDLRVIPCETSGLDGSPACTWPLHCLIQVRDRSEGALSPNAAAPVRDMGGFMSCASFELQGQHGHVWKLPYARAGRLRAGCALGDATKDQASAARLADFEGYCRFGVGLRDVVNVPPVLWAAFMLQHCRESPAQTVCTSGKILPGCGIRQTSPVS